MSDSTAQNPVTEALLDFAAACERTRLAKGDDNKQLGAALVNAASGMSLLGALADDSTPVEDGAFDRLPPEVRRMVLIAGVAEMVQQIGNGAGKLAKK